MLGFLTMFAGSAVIGWFASAFMGPFWGVAIAVLVFGVWFKFNVSQGTMGLFKANLRSFFAYRRAGQSVETALQSMVAARYWFSEKRCTTVKDLISQIPQDTPDDQKVIHAVWIVFCFDQGEPPIDLYVKYLDQLSNLYNGEPKGDSPLFLSPSGLRSWRTFRPGGRRERRSCLRHRKG